MKITNNKHEIFAHNDLKTSVVDVEEWNCAIKIRAMSVGEQLDFSENLEDKDMTFKLLVKCCITDDDKPLFEEKDIELLKKKSPESVFKLSKAILVLNKMHKDAVDEDAKN